MRKGWLIEYIKGVDDVRSISFFIELRVKRFDKLLPAYSDREGKGGLLLLKSI